MAADRYTIISADTHAGGSHEQYREYLDPAFRDDFDAWRGQYKNPWKDLRDTDLRIRNWDDDRRDADQLSRRRGGRGRLPQHRAALLPGLRAVRRPAEGGGLHPPPGRHPRPQPVDEGLLRPSARAPRRHRPVLPQRHRRRPRGHHLDRRERPARRRAVPDGRPRREVGEAPLRPRLRPDLGPHPGPRHPAEPPLGHRLARLRHVRRHADAAHQRGRVLRLPRAQPLHPLRRVRALPPPQGGAHRGLGRRPAPDARGARPGHQERAGRCHRRAEVPLGGRRPEAGQRVLRPELLDRLELPEAQRRRGRQDGRPRPLDVGQRLPPRRGHPAVHP